MQSFSVSLSGVLCLLLACAAQPSGPVRIIDGLGAARGVVDNESGVETYMALRFAEPPRRFEVAKPATPWEGVYDASRWPPACSQKLFPPATGSEDCLFLTVWTPGGTAPGAGLPVMVWIHGGGLSFGSGSEMPGLHFVRGRGVVLAAVQYRLGIFGFYDHPHLKAVNFGLRDQQLALIWVRDHIASLGGDPARVAIFGPSSGGVSVAMHLASPLSKGLFSAAISQSPWTNHQTGNLPRSYAQMLSRNCARSVCGGANSTQQLECLRTIDALVLLNEGKCGDSMAGHAGDPFNFAATYDGQVLLEPLWTSFQDGRTHPVPFIVGSTRDEWNWFIAIYLAMGTDVVQVLEHTLEALGSRDKLQEVYALYSTAAHPDATAGQSAATAALTDLLVTCPARHYAARGVGNTWRYLFSRAVAFRNRTHQRLMRLAGSYHTLVLNFVFDTWGEFPGQLSPTAQDMDVARAMQEYWLSLASAGEPRSSLAPWPEVGRGPEQAMLEFKANGTASLVDGHKFRLEQCEFFDRLLSRAFELPVRLHGRQGQRR